MLTSILKAIFGSKSSRDIKRLMPKVKRINEIEAEYQKLTEDQLKAEFGENGWKQLPDAVSRRYRFVPAKVEVDEHHIGVYASKTDGHMVKADHPKGLLHGSPVSPTLAAAAVGHDPDSHRNAAQGTDQINSLLHASAFGHHVFRHNDLFARTDREAAFEHQLIVFLVRENCLDPEGTGQFLAYQDPADCGGNDRFRTEVFHAFRQCAAKFFRHIGITEKQSALEKFIAVHAAAQNKMSIQQCSRILKTFDDFLICHFKCPFSSRLKFI